MNSRKYIAITLLAGLLLTGGLIPKSAQARGEVRDEDSPATSLMRALILRAIFFVK